MANIDKITEEITTFILSVATNAEYEIWEIQPPTTIAAQAARAAAIVLIVFDRGMLVGAEQTHPDINPPEREG